MPKSTLNPHVITFDPDLKSPDKGFDNIIVVVNVGHKVNFNLKAVSGGPPSIAVQITAKPNNPNDPTKLFGVSSFEVTTGGIQQTVQPHEFGSGKPERYEYQFERAPLFREGGGPVGGMTGTITVSPPPGRDE
jgi:hypothetical protein